MRLRLFFNLSSKLYIVHNQCGNCHVICCFVCTNVRGERKDRMGHIFKKSFASRLAAQTPSTIFSLAIVTHNKQRILIHRIGVKPFVTSTFCASRMPVARQNDGVSKWNEMSSLVLRHIISMNAFCKHMWHFLGHPSRGQWGYLPFC